MKKVRYEVDPHNRLVIEKTGRKTRLSRYRRVINGIFKIDKKNRLIYHVKSPIPDGIDIPHQIKLKGRWSLTDDHNLRLTFDKWKRETFGDRLTLQGHIIDVKKNALLFSITTKTKDEALSTHILKLQGEWQADKYNRLIFRVNRERGKHDILIFNGVWKIDKNHRVIYQYQKARLIRKRKKLHTLTFRGHWDITDKTRISYVIDKETGSLFNFKATLDTFEHNYIKYRLGIGLSHKAKPQRRLITLFGTWKIKKGMGLIFEVEYEKREVHAILFGAEARLTKKDMISLRLKNSKDEELGAELKLSRRLLKGDGEAFLRLLKSERELVITAGAGRRW